MSSNLSMDQEVGNLKSYFTSQSFNVSHEWLYGCIEYFRSEKPNCTDSEMKNSVLKQWELSDLRDSSNGCLPGNLKSHKIITLRGKYVLQIESVINIGASAYSQFQKTRKVDIGNVELTEKKPETWEPKASRMLKMSLCDGPHFIEAIEHHPLPMLNEHITPGTKMMIMGPVDCRRGCLFLKSQNCKIIGGEVDSLLVTNHMENMLRRALSLVENPEPYSNPIVESSVPPSSRSEFSTQTSSSSHVQSTAQSQRVVSQTPIVTGSSTAINHQTVNSISRRNRELCPEVEVEVEDLDVSGWADDDLFVDDEALVKIEEEHATFHGNAGIASTSASTGFVSKKRECSEGTISAANSENIIHPKIPKFNSYKSDSNEVVNSHKSVLASDEYVDYMLMDEWDDEINDDICFDKSSNVSGNKQHSEAASSSYSVNMLTSKVNDVSSNKSYNQHQKQSYSYSAQGLQKPSLKLDETDHLRNSLSTSKGQVTDKPEISRQPQINHLFTSSTSKGQELFKKPESARPGQSQKINISQRCKIPSTSTRLSSSTVPAGSIKSFFKPSSSSHSNFGLPDDTDDCQVIESDSRHKQSIDIKSSKLNADKKDDLPLFNSKTSDVEPKRSPFPLDNLDTEADWADAYLDSQNLSFTSQLNDLEKTESSSPKTRPQPLFSCSSKGTSFARDVPKRYPFSSDSSSEFKVPGHKLSREMKDSFQNSKSHLPAAFCGPHDGDDNNLDVMLVPIEEMSAGTSGIRKSPDSLRTKPVLNKSSTAISLTKYCPPWICPIKSSEPFEYLLHILHSPTKSQGIHKVKATILSLLSQLVIDVETGWKLSATICDGTATLDVRFSSEVLEEMIGLSHKEFKQMKRDASKNPLIKEKLLKVLTGSQQKLIDLNCILTIKFNEGTMADVIKISEVTEHDVKKLELRLLNT